MQIFHLTRYRLKLTGWPGKYFRQKTPQNGVLGESLSGDWLVLKNAFFEMVLCLADLLIDHIGISNNEPPIVGPRTWSRWPQWGRFQTRVFRFSHESATRMKPLPKQSDVMELVLLLWKVVISYFEFWIVQVSFRKMILLWKVRKVDRNQSMFIRYTHTTGCCSSNGDSGQNRGGRSQVSQ